MKNIANYISISRLLLSVILIALKPLSFWFYIVYIYCGISDMLDGYIARKTKNTSSVGNFLDSISDMFFVIISIIKIMPALNLHNSIIIWVIIIALIKIFNIIYTYIYYKKLIFFHTAANKITGLLLFIFPLLLWTNNYVLFEIIICNIATFSAIQEGYYIKANMSYKKYHFHKL